MFVPPRFALGIEARTGIVAVPDAGFRPAVLAGQTSFAMPLDLALRFAPEGRLGEERTRRDRLHYGLRFSHAGNSQIAPPWREPRPRYR